MNGITNILMEIEKRPYLFFKEKDLRLLHCFIDGYMTCEYDNNQSEAYMFFQSFEWPSPHNLPALDKQNFSHAPLTFE